MFKNNLGYIFECKKDNKGVTGIKEGFSFSYKEDIQRVNAIFSIDINGNILCPAYFDKATGFTPLVALISADSFVADIEKFVKSNRATYSLVSATYLVCSLDAKISKSTGQWLQEDMKINFYVPKGNILLGKIISTSTEEWGMICDIAAPSGKLNTFHVSEGVLNGYKQLVLSQLSDAVRGDKKTYIGGRLSKYISRG